MFFDDAIARNPGYAYAYANRGLAGRTAATYRFDRGEDPSPSIAGARSDLERALSLNPQIFWAYPEKTAVELLAARSAVRSSESPQPFLEAASATAAQALVVNPRNAVAFQSAAEVHRWRAEDRLRRGLSVHNDLVEGRRLVERALAINPELASAMVTGTALMVIQAESEESPATRRALAADASRTLAHALTINPLLERETAELRHRITNLTSRQGAPS
jgi:tetratricopeptide (TPR) repeat protein